MSVETIDKLTIPVNDYSKFSEGGSIFSTVTHVLKDDKFNWSFWEKIKTLKICLLKTKI